MQVGVEEAGREFPIHWVRKMGAEEAIAIPALY